MQIAQKARIAIALDAPRDIEAIRARGPTTGITRMGCHSVSLHIQPSRHLLIQTEMLALSNRWEEPHKLGKARASRPAHT